MNFSRNIKITRAISPAEGVAGTTGIAGATLDMAGFESVLMEVVFGTITTGAATSIKAQQGSASDMSDAVDLAGTGQTVADDDDNKIFYIDLVKPTKRYVRVFVNRGTQNAVVASATYFQYGAGKAPVVHGAEVKGELHASPAEGAA